MAVTILRERGLGEFFADGGVVFVVLGDNLIERNIIEAPRGGNAS
jgi:hypothetical protein